MGLKIQINSKKPGFGRKSVEDVVTLGPTAHATLIMQWKILKLLFTDNWNNNIHKFNLLRFNLVLSQKLLEWHILHCFYYKKIKNNVVHYHIMPTPIVVHNHKPNNIKSSYLTLQIKSKNYHALAINGNSTKTRKSLWTFCLHLPSSIKPKPSILKSLRSCH